MLRLPAFGKIHLLLFAPFLLTPQAASATQVLALDVDGLTDRASVAVWGDVVSARAERSTIHSGRIVTRVVVAVRESLKSDAASAGRTTVEFVVPGGELHGIGQWVPGAPRFHPGAEVVVLAARRVADKQLVLVGLGQGRYLIERRAGIAPVAVSPRRGMELLRRAADGRLRPDENAATEHRLPLNELLQRIRTRQRVGPAQP